MALALRLEKLLATGVVKDFRTLASLGHVSPARISQILSLLHLAPDFPGSAAVPESSGAWPGLPGPAARVAAYEGLGLVTSSGGCGVGYLANGWTLAATERKRGVLLATRFRSDGERRRQREVALQRNELPD
jgi:hypothetical protein